MSLDDDDFEGDMYDSELSSPTGAHDEDDGRTQLVLNQPHDEEVSLSDTESFGGDSHLSPTSAAAQPPQRPPIPKAPTPAPSEPPPKPELLRMESRKGAADALGEPTSTVAAAAAAAATDSYAESGAYNAMDYKHLNVSDEIRELFKYIGRFKPQNIELETKLKPFIPDYIPAVGGIDEFIKVPRPDGRPDYLGLKVLDEPAAKQSDPTVLNLQLRQLNKEAAGGRVEVVGKVEHTDENRQKKITQWISSIQDIQKAKPPAVVRHEKPMPELETLMQEWPPEMEALLRNMHMPSADLDLDLPSYVKLVCSVLDIPVHQDPIPSMHVLFSLLLEFRTNPFFRHHLDSGPFVAPGFGESRAQTAASGATRSAGGLLSTL